MPKKFKGENSKAVEAKAKKNAVKQAEDERKEKAKEDEYWRDDDKHVMRKQDRKEDKEKKRLEQLERKKELQLLHDEEMSSIKSNKPQSSGRLTRDQIKQNLERERREAEAQGRRGEVEEVPLEENINRQMSTEGEARSVEAALSVLSVKQPEVDMHPEKRVKAAYQKYEEERLPELKKENPNLRLSQLKQMLRKDWMKSPENPLNQHLMQS